MLFQAALNMVSKCMSHELKDEGILVVSLHPGWVQTDMGGEKAPLAPQESIAGMLQVIGSLTQEQSGLLMDYKGDILPYWYQKKTPFLYPTNPSQTPFNTKLTPKHSIAGMLKVIGSLTKEQSGLLMDYKGDILPYWYQEKTPFLYPTNPSQTPFNTKLTTKHSIEGMMKVIGSLTKEQSGLLMDYKGDILPY